MAYRSKIGRRDSNGKLHLNEDEAHDVIEVMARTKEFWIEDIEINQERLQSALDVTHNTVEGNEYVVDISESTYSRRLSIYCGPCATSLTSYDPFVSHDRGRNHKKAQQNIISRKDAERCANQKISFKLLNSVKKIFEPDSLEEMIDFCNSPVLGIQFVFKEKLKRDSNYVYSCQLCNIKQISKHRMYEHLAKSATHNREYLRKKYDEVLTNTHEYKKRCEEIEMLEGKITCNIIDFSRQNIMLESLFGADRPATPPPSPPGRHRSPSPQPPLGVLNDDRHTQTLHEEMEQILCLPTELAKMNMTDEVYTKITEKDSMELLMQTLQTLNLKMHTYYKKGDKNSTKYTSKYHSNLMQMNKCIQEDFSQ